MISSYFTKNEARFAGGVSFGATICLPGPTLAITRNTRVLSMRP